MWKMICNLGDPTSLRRPVVGRRTSRLWVVGMCSLDVDRHSHKDVRQDYGVATISRLLKIIGLLCRISSLL